MEWKIGEIRQVNGEWYQCVEGNGCENCAFKGRKCYLEGDTDDPIGECCYDRRRDNKDVIFKKLEKVGEPYEYFIQGMGIIMVQEYIIANTNYIWDISRNIVVMDCPNGKVAIEIKQNRENMEEITRSRIFQIATKYINGGVTFDEFEKAMRNWINGDKRESKPNLKPFDLEAAKAGKPVCTRDGRKARIICFDAKGDYPIIALIDNTTQETDLHYTLSGRAHVYTESEYDLMMLPEKKEGWIVIHKEAIYDKETAEKIARETTADVIRIQKIEWEE